MIIHSLQICTNRQKNQGLTHPWKRLEWKPLGRWAGFSRSQFDSIFNRSKKCNGFVTFSPQVEAIHSYNTMKDNLMEYLAKFANSKKVVREEDIKEFFDGMKKNKKMKSGGPPPSCK